MTVSNHYATFDAPDLAPIVACERTSHGWRGLTGDGEILNVENQTNGTPMAIPLGGNLAMMRGGRSAGYRAMPKDVSDGVIDRYEQHLRASATLLRGNQLERALGEIEQAMAIAPTAAARLNRAMILLAMGRWPEGFDDFLRCEQESDLFMRPRYRAAIARGLRPWRGESLYGKRLLLMHDHGFGDSIMMLRYVPKMKAAGIDVVLQLPPPLRRLATQLACPIVEDDDELLGVQYVCSILMLLQMYRVTPEQITAPGYLRIEPTLVEKWAKRLGDDGTRRFIGVAWSVGQHHDGDYPRAIPLSLLTKTLSEDAELVSVQQQGEAEADMLGVRHFKFEDFADCAALMMLMDEIVSIDTAALHLAGAIGHPRITALLSHWHSWRWRANVYENITFCRQDTPGDWDSALARCTLAKHA